MTKSIVKFSGLVDMIQKITIYETNHSFYIVGTGLASKTYKVIKIDRTCDPRILSYSEDMHEYNEDEIRELISMVNIDNNPYAKSISSNLTNNGIIRTYNALALIGFIRFTEGYYMMFVTKQTEVAVVGYHIFYSIDDVVMIYIPFTDKAKREANLDEQKYLKMFQLIDLRQNFYYSYTYDLTNTLQHNLSDIKKQPNENSCESGAKFYGYKSRPCSKFLWNEYFLKPVSKKLNYQWVVHLIHGYLAQSSLNIYGCNLLVTLISRRSQKYAGTRFLKRGGTNEGYVANEVETEQIVHNATISSFRKGYFTSFVFCRGSIPLFWSQDPKQVPKPPINIDISDPFAIVSARHFKQLLTRFGAPIIILNLVKMQKKAQESVLAEEYRNSLDYLKQFLPKDDFIEYICFDMAKLNKTDKGNVMNKLYQIAENCVKKTRFFKNFDSNDLNMATKNNESTLMLQNGIVRVNCVDCLDRTNTAMYVVGKCAFTHQLYALGLLSSLRLEPDGTCEKMLIDLYEKCGDAIAQQYAGSQLVHRVDTYGKNSLASQSRDMIHTISRYYSNAFADADKQNAINIFLGIFQPYLYNFHIWDLEKDVYLHDSFIIQPWKISKNYIEWIDNKVFKCLPLSYEQEYKSTSNLIHIEEIKDKDDYKISEFDNFYRPHELTAFHELFYFSTLNSNRITNANQGGSFSGNIKAIILDPFMTKTKKPASNNTSTSKISSFQISNSSDEDYEDSYDMIQDVVVNQTQTKKDKIKKVNSRYSITNFFEISEESMKLYRKYINDDLERMLIKPVVKKELSMSQFSSCSIISVSKYDTNTIKKQMEHQLIETPVKKQYVAKYKVNESSKPNLIETNKDPIKQTSDETLSIYLKYLNCGVKGPTMPSEKTLKLYESYVNQLKNAENSVQ